MEAVKRPGLLRLDSFSVEAAEWCSLESDLVKIGYLILRGGTLRVGAGVGCPLRGSHPHPHLHLNQEFDPDQSY